MEASMDLSVVYIGKNLKDARFRAGLTQAELAEKAGTTQTTVARIERDAVQPEVTTIRKLAAALGVTISDLLD
jgi:transcriptional regulator with XRE-family HTH domain